MAASWTTYFWGSGTSTAPASGTTILVNASSALAFGSGVRTAFMSNITINNYNSSLHWCNSTAAGAIDICAAPHMVPIYPVKLAFTTGGDSSNACYVGTATGGKYQIMAVGTPLACRGIGFLFNFSDYAVKASPVQAWAGSGTNVDVRPVYSYIAIVDLTSSSPKWSTATNANRLQLKNHGTACNDHWWTLGVSIAPLAVGHRGENKIRTEVTYY